MTEPANTLGVRSRKGSERRALMGPGFWVALLFCLLCVAAGAALVIFGPTLSLGPWRPGADHPQPMEPRSSAGQPHGMVASSTRSPERTDPNGPMDRPLAQRDAAMASGQAALAAATLLESAQSSRPFSTQLSILIAASPGSSPLRSLQHLAATGAPSRAALAKEYPIYAARAAAASRPQSPGLWGRVTAMATKVVMIRRINNPSGAGVDARLAQAELQLDDGDLDDALRTLDGLPPAAKTAIEPWRLRALDRTEVDRQVAAIRSQAVQDLIKTPGGGA